LVADVVDAIVLLIRWAVDMKMGIVVVQSNQLYVYRCCMLRGSGVLVTAFTGPKRPMTRYVAVLFWNRINVIFIEGVKKVPQA